MEQRITNTLNLASHRREGLANRRWLESGLIVAFWTFMALLQIGQWVVTPYATGGESFLTTARVVHLFAYYFLWALLTPVIFRFSHRFGIERANWFRRFLLHFGIGILVALFIDVYEESLRYVFGLRNDDSSFNLLQGLFDFRLFNELTIYIGVLAAGFARDYLRQYQARQDEAIQLQAQATQLRAQLAESRLATLRMQLNPHFLFNTLHAVSSLVERDPRGVRRMIARLSDLLRYTLEGASEQEVPLKQEVEFLNRYLDIEQIRFQGKLEVKEDIPSDLHEALVPNLILQPLVENAIKHGVSKTDGSGRIDLRAWREGEMLYLSVLDNGPGASGDGAYSEDPGVGLRNTRARLEGLYGSVASLMLDEGTEGGFVATIQLPYHTSDDLLTIAVQE